jgi:hypothetical protein
LCKAIIEQDRYPPIQRWVKLVNHVKGEAAQHIQGLQITDDSYNEAMKILESFYGNEDEIELELLRQWNALKPAHNIEQVRQLLIQVNRLNRQFASISVETNLTVFKHHLITRLPSWVVKKIWKQKSDKSMDELIKEAEDLIKQEDFVARIQQESAQLSTPSFRQSNSTSQVSTQSSPRQSNLTRQENDHQHWNSQADKLRQNSSNEMGLMGVETDQCRQETVMMSKRITITSLNSRQTQSGTIFFDTGCSINLINKEFAEKLELHLQPSSMEMTTLNGQTVKSTALTEFFVESPNGKLRKIKAQVVDKIATQFSMAPDVSNSMRILKEQEISVISAQPDILIGLDDYCQARIRGTETILSNGLRVMKSEFGLMVCGRLNVSKETTVTVTNCAVKESPVTVINCTAESSPSKANSDKGNASFSRKEAGRDRVNLTQVKRRVAWATDKFGHIPQSTLLQTQSDSFKAGNLETQPFRSNDKDRQAGTIKSGGNQPKKRLRSPFNYGKGIYSISQEDNSGYNASSTSTDKFEPKAIYGHNYSRIRYRPPGTDRSYFLVRYPQSSGRGSVAPIA